jgi:hypothetical protein
VALAAIWGTTYSATNNTLASMTAATYPPGNNCPASTAAVAMTDYAAGDYSLLPASPYVNTASDGTDPGADLSLLAAAISGVAV